MRWGSSGPAGDNDRSSRGGMRRSASERRPDDSTRWSMTASAIVSEASKSGSSGSFLISTLTHMPAHTSSASPRVAIDGGNCSGRVSQINLPSTRFGLWCTTSEPSTIRRTSSSTASAPISHARRNATIVFSLSACEAPRCASISTTDSLHSIRERAEKHGNASCQIVKRAVIFSSCRVVRMFLGAYS